MADSAEIQAQIEEQKKNCIFCKIINGEMQSSKVYEDKHMVGVLDINPCVKGHVLLMPKEHYFIMPQLPAEIFYHMFSLVGKLSSALKKAMLCTGVNLFIANGGIAGQQSPHFLMHLIPRESGDNIEQFYFLKSKDFNDEEAKKINSMLSQNLPQIFANALKSNPSVLAGSEKQSSHKLDYKELLYQDGKLICAVPSKQLCRGHMVIYSKEEHSLIDNLSKESCSHIFQTASYCAVALFEGMRAQGTNIILKSGISDDNPDGLLAVHIIPRYQDDGINLIPQPMKKKPNFKEIESKIKDKTFIIEHEQKDKKPEKPINLDELKKPQVITYSRPEPAAEEEAAGNENEKSAEEPEDSLDEIRRAILLMQQR